MPKKNYLTLNVSEDDINEASKRNMTVVDQLKKFNLNKSKSVSKLNFDEIEINDNQLAVALYDFKGADQELLNIKKGDEVVILNSDVKDGMAYGYIKGNESIKGLVPSIFLQIPDGNENENANE